MQQQPQQGAGGGGWQPQQQPPMPQQQHQRTFRPHFNPAAQQQPQQLGRGLPPQHGPRGAAPQSAAPAASVFPAAAAAAVVPHSTNMTPVYTYQFSGEPPQIVHHPNVNVNVSWLFSTVTFTYYYCRYYYVHLTPSIPLHVVNVFSFYHLSFWYRKIGGF